MQKTLLVLPLLAAVLFLVTGCGKRTDVAGAKADPVKRANKLTVGFAQIETESAWRVANTKSIQAAAKDRGITLVFSDAQRKQENQIKALRSFVAQHVDVIVLAPVVETGWEPVFQEIKQANIPLVLSDRDVTVVDPGLHVTFVGSDFVAEGKKAGEWLARKMRGTATLVELSGTPGAAPTLGRLDGFKEVLKTNPGLSIFRSQSGDFTRAKGKEVIAAILRAPELKSVNAVYSHNDEMALGAIQAIEDAGLQPGKDIVIVSVDGIKGALEAINAGKLNCSVECNPLTGGTVMDLAEQLAAHQEVPRHVYSQEGIFDASGGRLDLSKRRY